jgi:hypothetical protein
MRLIDSTSFPLVTCVEVIAAAAHSRSQQTLDAVSRGSA